MASDDLSFDAAKRQQELEDASISPIPKILIRLLSRIPTSNWLVDRVIAFLKARLDSDANERIKVMLDSFAIDLRRLDSQVRALHEAMSPEEKERRVESAQALLLDGARKAAATRSIERVGRIGLILSNALVEPRAIDEDEIEEAMRIATELGDEEVRYLAELVKLEGETVARQGWIERFDAHRKFEHGFWGTRPGGRSESIFRKLESYGLVATIPPSNSVNILTDLQTRFALLSKGLRFVELIRARAA